MTDLMPLLTQLSGMGADMLWAALLVFLRVGAAMALLPAFGEQSVPQRLRLVLSLAFTAIVAPAIGAVPDPAAGVILPLAIEVLVGLALGIALRLFILSLQIAAAIAAQTTSLSQLFGGVGPDPQPAIANMLVMAGLALAVASGLHVHVAQVLILSYQMLPAGSVPGSNDMAQWGVANVAHAFALGFALAAPFTIASLLYNIALGVINRAMPALMVSFIGAPALALGGVALMAVVAPLMLVVWQQSFQSFLSQPFGPLP